MRVWLAVLLVPVVAAAAPSKKPDPKKQAAEQAARGDAWAVADRCDEAVKAYRQALTLQPKNAVVQVRMAHCLAKTGGAAEAKQILTTLADESGATGLSALQELGDLALQSGDFAGAVDAYDKLLAKSPTNVDARMALLDALKGASDAGDAKAQARGLELAKKMKTEPKADAGQQRHAEELVAMFTYGDAAKDLHRRQAHVGDGRSQGRRDRARARRRQARRSRGGAVSARARVCQSRSGQEGRRAQSVEEGGARQRSGAGARRRRLRRRRSRRGGQALEGRGRARRRRIRRRTTSSGSSTKSRARRRRRARRGRAPPASIRRASSASGRRRSCKC